MTNEATLSKIQSRCVTDDNGCWIWQGPVDKWGYARGGPKGPGASAQCVHRRTWQIVNGPVPAGMQMDHFRCDIRSCVNPEHVRPVTPRENSLRSGCVSALNLAKTHCPQGHPYDEANTYVNPTTGFRQCQTCLAAHRAKRRTTPAVSGHQGA